MTEIFRKGDAAQCSNYRPISLLNLGDKLFASLLLRRLKDSGTDSFIWPTQYGFKAGMGTADALFATRRLIERTWNSKAEKKLFLALDWAKTIDSISPSSLAIALTRFGLPSHFVEMFGAIYSSRKFYVDECNTSSNIHHQHYGISQGCPLSPYLFIIVMSVLMEDSHSKLRRDHGVEFPVGSINEIVYADDTLLVGSDAQTVEKQLSCIVELGRAYGLEMNWQKVELMTVRCDLPIRGPDATELVRKTSLVYLGSSVSADGNVDSELARRIGLAQSEFKRLAQVWRHTSLDNAEKYRVYRTCVLSRLLYGLQASWLGKVGRRKLDGFHARCARHILNIAPSYFSRVSNKEVLSKLGAPTLSAMLLQQQLNYFGKLARRPHSCKIRSMVFKEDLSMQVLEAPRRRGRPRLEWTNEIFKVVGKMFESHASFSACVSNAMQWRSCIRTFSRAATPAYSTTSFCQCPWG